MSPRYFMSHGHNHAVKNALVGTADHHGLLKGLTKLVMIVERLLELIKKGVAEAHRSDAVNVLEEFEHTKPDNLIEVHAELDVATERNLSVYVLDVIMACRHGIRTLETVELVQISDVISRSADYLHTLGLVLGMMLFTGINAILAVTGVTLDSPVDEPLHGNDITLVGVADAVPVAVQLVGTKGNPHIMNERSYHVDMYAHLHNLLLDLIHVGLEEMRRLIVDLGLNELGFHTSEVAHSVVSLCCH